MRISHNRLTTTRAGFTLLELLLVVAISTFGFMALARLQTASIRGMKTTSTMAAAVSLAENFIEDMRLEFSQWTPTRSLEQLGVNSVPHLAGLPTGGNVGAGAQTPGSGIPSAAGWVIGGETGANRLVPVAGDVRTLNNTTGAVVTLNAGIRAAMNDPNVPAADERFCLRYRLTWLVPGKAMRLEVEVSWPFSPIDLPTLSTCAYAAADRLNEVRSVTLTSALMINLFRK